MPDPAMFILADMGATNTRIARSDDLSHVGEPIIWETERTYEAWLASLIANIQKAASGATIDAIAMGVPIVLSRGKRQLLNAIHLPDWAGKDLVGALESALGTRVFLENDAALVGLGEAHFGAGKGAEIMVYITISTGVNGVRIVNGRIDPSVCGFEIGYQYISIEPELKRWSRFISGRAIHERFGVHPKELGKDHAVWEELARYAAIGVHNTILHWSPDRVVLGGSMMNEIGIPVDRIAFHVKDVMQIFPSIPEIVHSELKDFGGLWGGLALLRQEKT